MKPDFSQFENIKVRYINKISKEEIDKLNKEFRKEYTLLQKIKVWIFNKLFKNKALI